MANIDLIICVALKDCLIVQKTIHNIRINIIIDDIYILTDKANFFFFEPSFLKKYHISLIDEEELVPDKNVLKVLADNHFECNYRFGWYYQQFLKMSFALSKYAKDYYLIWDSDTIPLNKLNFIENDTMIFTPKTEFHQPYFMTLQTLLGYGKEVDYSFIAEHMIVYVPFMKELIRKIEDSPVTGDSWIAKIINATPADDRNTFSEFETYGTYCHHNHAASFKLKNIRTYREGGKRYSRGISQKKLDKLSQKHDTISLEIWHTPRFPRNIRNKMEIHYLNFISFLRKKYPRLSF